MDNARQIEATLLQAAADTLQHLQAAADKPATVENDAEFLMEWHRLGALIELAYISSSGLTGTTVHELLLIDNEAAAIFRRRLVRGATACGHVEGMPDMPH